MGVMHEIRKYGLLAAAHLVAGMSEQELKLVRSVIIFGSVAQGSAAAESDIDIFFDSDAHESARKTMRAKLNRLAEEFYTSSAALRFKLRGIANELSITIGKLEEWTELSRSIASAGIVVYGQYARPPAELKSFTILSWEKPGRARGAFLNKLYGYRAGKKHYSGILEKAQGAKLGKSSIFIPSASRQKIIDVFEKYKVDYSRYDVWL